MRVILLVAAALCCLGLAGFAQPTAQPDKKTDAKGADDKTKAKDTGKAKMPDAAKDAPKTKIPVEKLITPSGAVIVVVDEMSSMFAKMILLTPEKYQELTERLKALELQLKPEKKAPFSCKLTVRLDGDFLVCRAVYVFSTEAPRTVVPLGLQGGHLLDDGDLDGQTPILDFNKEEGFTALVEKEGRQKLTLNFRVPVQVKEAAAGAVKRGIDLGLPGAPVTIVHVELPPPVKELRWNETLEKTKTPGRWQLGLEEKSKSLSLSWKEPVAVSGTPPLATAEGQIKVEIDEKDVHINAELILQDSRLQTKDWRIQIPPQATIDEKAIRGPTGLTFQLFKPDDKMPYYILRASDATAERWQVPITLNLPRPNPPGRVPVGPFHVFDASSHQGTISVKMKGDASFGQRLVYVRNGKTYQKSADAESVFRYEAPPVTGKNLKSPQVQQAPLELEWRLDKNQQETQVEHVLRVRASGQGYEIDAATRINVTALFSVFNAIDIKLPARSDKAEIAADEYDVAEESGIPLRVTPPDATGKVRITLDRGPAPKKIVLVLKNKIRVPADRRRIRLDVPRPLFTQDRGAKVSLKSDDRLELLYGPEGAEEPVPDHDHFELSLDQAPVAVDLAWRPFQREIIAESTIDITLYERTAQVKQTLRFPRDPTDAKNSQVSLALPAGIGPVRRLPGGELVNPDARKKISLLPADDGDKATLILQYDLAINEKQVDVLSIWPAHVSQKDAKVRVWTYSGVKVRAADGLGIRAVWKERSTEKVDGVDQFPALVLRGFGADLPLVLKIEAAATMIPAAFLADRALIQAQIVDDDQHCRARYWLRKIQAPYVDIELPIPRDQLRELATVSIGPTQMTVEKIDADDRVLRVRLPVDQLAMPAILEIKFILPGEVLPTTSPWRTTLYAPVFRSPVVIKQMRWQYSAPHAMICAALGRNVRPDVAWSWQGWLPTPEPAVSGAELDVWLTGKEPTSAAPVATYSFWHITTQPETIYHLPRQGWLIGCSGIFLILTLGAYYAPMPRRLFVLVLLAWAGGLLALLMLSPAAVPSALFGIQPGVVLFLVFVGIHWLLQERYRRQLVFLPGFSRGKPGSTMTRTNTGKRPREASTVDVPEAKAEDAASKSTGSSS